MVDLHPKFFEMFSILPESAEKNGRKNMNIFCCFYRQMSFNIFKLFIHNDSSDRKALIVCDWLGSERKQILRTVFLSLQACWDISFPKVKSLSAAQSASRIPGFSGLLL